MFSNILRSIAKGTFVEIVLIVAFSPVLVAEAMPEQDIIFSSGPVTAEEKPSAIDISQLPDKEKTSHPKLEQILYELAGSNDPGAFAREKGIAMTDGKVRVIIMLSDDENVPVRSDLLIEEKDGNLIQALVPVDAIIDIAEDPNVNFIKIPDRYIPAKENAGTPKQADYPLPWGVLLIAIIFLIKIKGGKKI